MIGRFAAICKKTMPILQYGSDGLALAIVGLGHRTWYLDFEFCLSHGYWDFCRDCFFVQKGGPLSVSKALQEPRNIELSINGSRHENPFIVAILVLDSIDMHVILPVPRVVVDLLQGAVTNRTHGTQLRILAHGGEIEQELQHIGVLFVINPRRGVLQGRNDSLFESLVTHQITAHLVASHEPLKAVRWRKALARFQVGRIDHRQRVVAFVFQWPCRKYQN
mmetsp:Transcript_21398/g.50284  ORF Transcript_21398/g.50284 Transcript_21398/m.50284 type:complete len:221 (+) Transcript_21398:1285-1947(+)